MAALAAACGSSATPAASSSGGNGSARNSAASASKGAFCADDVKLDKAGSAVMSMAGYVQVLKTNQSLLTDMAKHLPSGSLGTEAQQLLGAANTAVSTDSGAGLSSPALMKAGADVDTYCGVDGSGDPVPSNFGQGKRTAFCSVDSQISAGTASATDAASVLAFLSSHRSLVDTFGADLSSLPSSIKSTAQTLYSTTQSAISTGNAGAFGSRAIHDATDVDLYCGINR
ncbi:MAG TPA: hypothetical protein VFH58_15390 [Acidimicrobiales bacterium]|nr:hypothetical protein [Acidimicrobiales bacterium]